MPKRPDYNYGYARPKYVTVLGDSIHRMSTQLENKATWLSINCGHPRSDFADVRGALDRLERAVKQLRRECSPR